MTSKDKSRVQKASQKIEEFKLKHSDMTDELKRRLIMLKMKNLKSLLKSID